MVGNPDWNNHTPIFATAAAMSVRNLTQLAKLFVTRTACHGVRRRIRTCARPEPAVPFGRRLCSDRTEGGPVHRCTNQPSAVGVRMVTGLFALVLPPHRTNTRAFHS